MALLNRWQKPREVATGPGLARPLDDVCLIVEGTYPYVAGGVSGWTHDLIRSLPELTFHLLAVLPPKADLAMRYKLPPNVSGVTNLFLDLTSNRFRRPCRDDKDLFARLEAGIEQFQEEGGLSHLNTILTTLAPCRERLSGQYLLNSKLGWQMALNLYEKFLPGGPFLDFFWTWRFVAGNLMTILLGPLPRARVYHAVSTGYAGLYLARARLETGRPVLVTEHGIYTNERRIEITMADWLYEKPRNSLQVEKSDRDVKGIWIKAFQAYSLACYQASERIITLYTGNQNFQKADGADPARMSIIPNGIDWQPFANLASDRGSRPPTIALIGRVVPIKDIKSFIRACGMVRRAVPEAKALIMGPLEEDKGYYNECRDLIQHQGLEEMITFTGRVKLTEYLGQIDVNVLTSISEGQPLVILEAGAAGVPSVSTDVGGCREMILGAPTEDPPLGPGGAVTPVSNPAETAKALVELLINPAWHAQCAAAIRERIKRYYDLADLKKAYQDIYDDLRRRPDAPLGSETY
ncbi:MAG: GT4 family glycosyltransferase PelF [Magnetococcales bacterium]|nr:GT4 family glycosyltransferase PelF [Magnetococcales bacterium]